MSEHYVQKQLRWPYWTWVEESIEDKHKREIGHIVGLAINLIFLAFYLGLFLGYCFR